MPTVFNLLAGDVVPQMGFSPTQNQNGGWQASRDYYMLASTWEGATVQNRFSRGTPITTADPSVSSVYGFLTIESKVASYEDSGTVRLTVNYTGSASAQFGGDGGGDLTLEALPVYRMEGRLRELPFSQHPKWKVLPDSQKYALGLLVDGHVIRDSQDTSYVGIIVDEDGLFLRTSDVNDNDIQLTGDALEFADRIGEGQSTWEAPTLTWTETTQGNQGLTPPQIGKLGEISTPRGNPPTIPGYNWMLTGASQEQKGELYQTTLEWTLSPPDGHDAFLYTFT